MNRAERRAALQTLLTQATDRPGHLEPALRRAAAQGQPLPPELAPVVEQIRTLAAQVTDADLDALRVAGYTEDQIYELVVAVALGASHARLTATRIALGQEPG